MSVNRPTNVKQKEADVNQKLQLYGIYSGMSRFSINCGRGHGCAPGVECGEIWWRDLVCSLTDLTSPTAFANGKVPSVSFMVSSIDHHVCANWTSQNKQIDIALNSFIASNALSKPSPKLSEEGRHLVADVRDVIEQAKILLLTKNEGNLLQDFIWQTGQISSGNAKLPGAPVDKDTAKQHGNQALEGLRTLGTLVLSNGQFRKLCEFHLLQGSNWLS